MTRILFALMFLSSPAFACDIGRDETGNDSFDIHICASNMETCDPADPNTNCEDIIVMPLTEEDLQAQPPTPEEQMAALNEWRRR